MAAKLPKFFFYIFFIAVRSAFYGEVQANSYQLTDEERASSIASAETTLKKITEYIPTKTYRNAAKTYLEIILGDNSYSSDKDVAFENSGMVDHFMGKEMESTCFQNSVAAFNGELYSLDTRLKSETSFFSFGDDLEGRPNMLDFAGEGKKRFGRIKKGDIWKMALRHAPNNDPNLALRLLAQTGHDDYGVSTENTSILFVNDSLGEGVRVSDEMRSRVIKQQAPTKGGSVLPSKNYHIIASAYLTCRLMEEGVSPKIAKKIQTIFAKAYRSLRFQQDFLHFDKFEDHVLTQIYTFDIIRSGSKEELPENFQWFPQFYPKMVKEMYNLCLPGSFKDEKLIIVPKLIDVQKKKERENFSMKNFKEKLCAPIKHLCYQVGQACEFKRIAGYSLYRHLYSRIRVNSKEFPTGKIRAGIPISKDGDIDLDKLFPKGIKLDEKDSKIAKEFVESIAVDMDWTEELHKVGSDFAIKNCKPEKYSENWDELFCPKDGAKPCHYNKTPLPLDDNEFKTFVEIIDHPIEPL